VLKSPALKIYATYSLFLAFSLFLIEGRTFESLPGLMGLCIQFGDGMPG
jgi:hypothetical protein